MSAELLIKILMDLNPKAEVKLWWDSGPRGEVEAIYTTSDGKTLVIAGEWSRREHEIANERHKMDFVPVFTKDKSLPCVMTFSLPTR